MREFRVPNELRTCFDEDASCSAPAQRTRPKQEVGSQTRYSRRSGSAPAGRAVNSLPPPEHGKAAGWRKKRLCSRGCSSSGFLQHPADGRSQSRERIRSQNHVEQKLSAVDNRLVRRCELNIQNSNNTKQECFKPGRTTFRPDITYSCFVPVLYARCTNCQRN